MDWLWVLWLMVPSSTHNALWQLGWRHDWCRDWIGLPVPEKIICVISDHAKHDTATAHSFQIFCSCIPQIKQLFQYCNSDVSILPCPILLRRHYFFISQMVLTNKVARSLYWSMLVIREEFLLAMQLTELLCCDSNQNCQPKNPKEFQYSCLYTSFFQRKKAKDRSIGMP